MVCGTYFDLDSVELPKRNIVRARFTRPPLVGSGASSARGDIVANYTLADSGGTTISIVQASVVSSDDEVIDLHLPSDIALGTWTLTVASTVESTDSPAQTIRENVYAFPVETGNDSTTSGGAVNEDNGDVIRRLLNPAFRGKDGWEELVLALASGDNTINSDAAKAFDQLYISSASGKYLDQRAGSNGIRRPKNTGISDSLFSDLVISIKNKKLTQESFLSALRVLYGEGAVRGFVETGVEEPFVLFDGAEIDFLLDGQKKVSVTFKRSDFSILRRATAEEVAATINRELTRQNHTAFAVAHRDPTTNKSKVRVYSGSKGIGSSIRVEGGMAQIFLDFPDNLFPVPDPAPSFPQWTITNISGDRYRLQADSAVLFDLAEVEVGDYIVVFGHEFDSGNRGSFEIVEAHFSHDLGSGALIQWVEVANPSGVAETVAQCEGISVGIYRKTNKTPYSNVSHTAVAQKTGDSLVSLAATTRAVNRVSPYGAYLQAPEQVEFSSLTRDPNGLVTVTLDEAFPSGLSEDDTVIVDDFIPSGVRPPGSSGGVSSFDADNKAIETLPSNQGTRWNINSLVESALSKKVKTPDGVLWFLGGATEGGGAQPTPTEQVVGVELQDQTIGTDESNTASLRWFRQLDTNIRGYGAAFYPIQTGSNIGKILEVGGYVEHPWHGDVNPLPITNDVFLVRRQPHLGPALSVSQFDDAEGVLAALGFYLTNQPGSGDLLTVTDGTTTRTYGFGSGGDVTVTIGATASDTMTNLATSITGDAGAAWSATHSTSYTQYSNTGLVVIVEDTVGASKSPLRIFGDSALSAVSAAVSYGTTTTVNPTYSNGTAAALPTSDPGISQAGFNVSVSGLQTDDTYEIEIDSDFRRWDGAAWSTTFFWATTTASAGVFTGQIADATMTQSTEGYAVLIGGSSRLNNAVKDIHIYTESTDTWGASGNLNEARTMPQSVRLDDSRVLVIGGRRPCDISHRTALGYSTWTFNDAFGSTNFSGGPVDVAVNGNTRVPGKMGLGVDFSTDSTSVGGAAQNTLNTDLLGDYTISGWMGDGSGVVFINGVAGSSINTDDNTLIAFGFRGDDLFLRWQDSGANTVEKVFTDAAVSFSTAPQRYHHFAITKTDTAGQVTFSLYIDGEFVDTATGNSPFGGSNGLWSFALSDEGDTGFTKELDLVGFTTTVLTAQQIKDQYRAELGVAYDNYNDVDASPIGRVLNSCEIINDNSGASVSVTKTGQMSDARYAAGIVKLPDGRVLAAGGIGYNPTRAPDYEASQRSSELKTAEIYDPASGIWTPLASMAEGHSYCLCEYVPRLNRVYIWGGMSSSAVEYLDLKTMRWGQIVSTPDRIRARAAAGILGDGIAVTLGGAEVRTSAPIAWETDVPGNARHYTAFLAKDTRWSGGINAAHRAVEGSAGTTLKFQTNHLHFTTNTSVTGKATKVAAAENAIEHPGPYAFDTKRGPRISGVTVVTDQKLGLHQTYSRLTVVSGANQLPSTGHLVLRYGYANQVVVPYISVISDTEIALDASFVFPATVPSGSVATSVESRSPQIPSGVEETGAFYGTDSPSGLVAARRIIQEISAAGIDIDFDIRYPGDRGMGAEGYPGEKHYKLSSKVWVWGGNNPDEDIVKARNGS